MNNLLLIILTCLCLTDSIAQKNVKAADSLILETEKFLKTIDTFQLNFHYHSIGSTFQCVKAKMDDGLIFKYRVHYRWSGVKKEKYVVKRRFSGKTYKVIKLNGQYLFILKNTYANFDKSVRLSKEKLYNEQFYMRKDYQTNSEVMGKSSGFTY